MQSTLIKIDDENPEWTKEEWSRAVKGSDFFSSEQLTAIEKFQLQNKTKKSLLIKVELEKDIVEKFQATGKDWKKRINDVLRKEKLA